MLYRAIILLLLCPALAFGALPATTVWEVQADGSDTNGGGFSAARGGTDYTITRTTPILSVSDAACSGNTTVTSATGGFTDAMKGNVMYLSSGPGWYEIVSVGNTNTVTIDRNGPSASGMTANVGGALKSLGGLGFIFQDANHAVAGMKCYVKNGTYNLDTATVNTAATTGHGGPLDLDASQQRDKAFYIKGYDAAQGRDSFAGTRPVIGAATKTPANAHVIELKGTSLTNPHVIAFLEIDGDDLTTSGFHGNSFNYDRVVSCISRNCDSGGFVTISAVNCLAHSNVGRGFDQCSTTFCRASKNGGDGFYYTSAVCMNCIADENGGDGFNSTALYYSLVNCVSCDNGSDGFQVYYADLVNCISYSNGAYEYNITSNTFARLINCASGDVASGRSSAVPLLDIGKVELTGDPFVDRDNATLTSRDFNLIATGAGLQCRAAGISPYGQTGYLDIGAVQHADPIIVVPDAKYLYNGQTVTSNGSALVTGTLNASNISAAKGSGSNLSAGILKKDEVVDDVTGTLEAGSGGGETSHVWVR